VLYNAVDLYTSVQLKLTLDPGCGQAEEKESNTIGETGEKDEGFTVQ
jgi:hypothetical protein